MNNMNCANYPVVILCGGKGTRIREETDNKPKSLVEIGNRPILWHIMKTYAQYNCTNFVLCLGYKGEAIKSYFLNYKALNSDFILGDPKGMQVLSECAESNWSVTLASTGLEAMTGARIKRIERYIETDNFLVTYGDGVADINIEELLKFHLGHGKIGTVTGVSYSSRFGELTTAEDRVVAFNEKPAKVGWISGGFFVFKKEVFKYLQEEDTCVLEKEPLERLAAKGELMVYKHKGFWQCLDTFRDKMILNDLWNSGDAKWKTWV